MDDASNNDEKGEGGELDALPPPIFPPGSSYRNRWSQPSAGRRTTQPRPRAQPELREEPHVSGFPLDAFISPDEPLHHRPKTMTSSAAAEDVIVTGIGDDPHLDDPTVAPEQLADPHLLRLNEMVGKLSHALHDRGEAGLRTTEGMSRFEATLRAYCVGWLAARRESAI